MKLSEERKKQIGKESKKVWKRKGYKKKMSDAIKKGWRKTRRNKEHYKRLKRIIATQQRKYGSIKIIGINKLPLKINYIELKNIKII